MSSNRTGSPADGPEIFWNFVVPVPVSTPRWVKAVEIRPGTPKVVHHASLLVDRAASARRHEAVPGAGFPGMDVSIDEATFDPDGVFLAWKPGSTPNVEPEGIAWRADPGMDLVFSVHLRPSGKPEIVDPVIALYFTDKASDQVPDARRSRTGCVHRHTSRRPRLRRDRHVSDVRSM